MRPRQGAARVFVVLVHGLREVTPNGLPSCQFMPVPCNAISAGACSTFGILLAMKLLPKVGKDQGRLILYLQRSL